MLNQVNIPLRCFIPDMTSPIILTCVYCNSSATLTTFTIAKKGTVRPRLVGRKGKKRRRGRWSKKGKKSRRREERSIITARRAPRSNLEMLTLVGPHIHGCRSLWNRSMSKSQITLGLRLGSSENICDIVSACEIPGCASVPPKEILHEPLVKKHVWAPIAVKIHKCPPLPVVKP